MLTSHNRAGRRAVAAISMAASISMSLVASQAMAADRTWSGIGTNSNFSTSGNWLFFNIPGSGDRALWTSSSSARSLVFFDTNPTVASAVVSGTNTAGSYNFQAASAGGLNVTGLFDINTSTGATPLTLNGNMHLSAGQVNVPASCSLAVSGAGTTVSTTGSLVLSGNGGFSVAAGASVTGYLDHTGTATATLNNATINAKGFNIHGGGTLEIQNGSVLTLNDDPYGLANDGAISAGTLRFLAGSQFNFVGNRTLAVTNTGLLDMQFGYGLPDGGSLGLSGGGKVTTSSYFDIGNGRFGTLNVSGPGSSLISSGSSVTDWGSNSGNALVTLSSAGVVSFPTLNIGANNGAATVKVQSSATLTTIGSLTVGGGSTSRLLSVSVEGGSLTVGADAVFNAAAAFSVSSGTVNFNGNATFNPSSTFSMTGGTLNIGSGKSLTINGTTATLAGAFALSNGATIDVTGGGTLAATNYIDFANSSGNTRTATLIVDGGSTYTTGSTYSDIGKYTNNTGTATFGGATAGTGNFNAGIHLATDGGKGTLNINANSVVSVATSFNAGGNAASVATVNVAGGRLNLNTNATFAAGSTLNYSAGVLFVGSGKTLTFDGGKANITAGGQGQSSGTALNVINGASFKSSDYFDLHTGTLLVDGVGSKLDVGGTSFATDWAGNTGDTAGVTISNAAVATYTQGLRLGAGGSVVANVTGGSTLQTQGGAFQVGGNGASDATLNISTSSTLNANGAGAALNIGQGGKVNLISGNINVAGGLALSGNGKLTLTPDAVHLFVVSATSLSIAGTSSIDLGDQEVNITYPGATPIAAIRDYIKSGRAGGTWNGPGINSSFVAAHPHTAISYDDSSGTISVIVTEAGDASYDLTVNFDDLVILAQNYNKLSGQVWRTGDFNYDGAVNFDDLVILAQNYNHLYPNVTAGNLSAGFASDWALAQSLVPEPTALLALTGALPLVTRRRRA